MKVHMTAPKNIENQLLLVKAFFGDKTRVVLTCDIFPRRDLSNNENGSLRNLIWNNVKNVPAGNVSAVVYNSIDGAYVINGVSDGKGRVVFAGFTYRPASTITIVTAE